MFENMGLRRIFGPETWGKRPLLRPRHRWRESITLNLHEVGWRGMD
jgi:hypothetical protein